VRRTGLQRQARRGNVDAETDLARAQALDDSASSISVVLLSSIENALCAASGRSAGGWRSGSGGKPVPLGKCSNRKRCQWKA
jgi:hypothetical protein